MVAIVVDQTDFFTDLRLAVENLPDVENGRSIGAADRMFLRLTAGGDDDDVRFPGQNLR